MGEERVRSGRGKGVGGGRCEGMRNIRGGRMRKSSSKDWGGHQSAAERGLRGAGHLDGQGKTLLARKKISG